MPTQVEGVAAGLRAWARGSFAEEAAVELLARAFDGRFCRQGAPWVRPAARPGWYSLDPDAIHTFSGGLSGGERRLLAVVAALAGDRPLEDLGGVLSGVDRAHLGLILAALAHAGGSHQHSDLVLTGNGSCRIVKLPALVAWPVDPARGLAGQETLL